MSNEPLAQTPVRRRFGGGVLLMLLLLLPAFYVLSVGPALKLYDRGMVSANLLETTYAPLIWLAEHCPLAGDFLDWYITDVWGWSLF